MPRLPRTAKAPLPKASPPLCHLMFSSDLSRTPRKEKPLFFHEEAIQSTGIRLIKNYQRARWINGATYQWLGVYKQLAKIEATSGLEFDTLKENK